MTTKSNKKVQGCIILFILLFSLGLNFWNLNFSYEYHIDEIKKVKLIQENDQGFFHPILLLQAAKLANMFLRYEDLHNVALVGRGVSAISGALTVWLIYLVARRKLSFKYAAATALAAATSPIIVVHSHYFKEDMVFSCCVLFSIYRLLRFFDHGEALCKPDRSWISLGFAVGLAFSAKYIGFLFVPILLFLPLILSLPDKQTWYKKILSALLLAFTTFLLINYPLFFNLEKFFTHLNYEITHALSGHGVIGLGNQDPIAITYRDFWFGFHLMYSIVPGMTLLMALFGVGCFLYAVFKWRVLGQQEKILVFTALFFYLAVECSPMKPFPDFMRYVLPIIPILLYFGFKGIQYLSKKHVLLCRIASPILLIGMGYAAWDSSQLIYHLRHDTRDLAVEWIAQSGKNVKGELYTTFDRRIRTVSSLDISNERKQGVEYLLVSNFMYDRIMIANRLQECPEAIRKAYTIYQNLFELPYIEIKPAHRSFAFSNPTIRIIDIRKKKKARKSLECAVLRARNQDLHQ